MEKEACERLGWGEDGIEDIMAHPYFSTIDWDMVSQRKLEPPYIPTIKNETDLSNFDEMFTNMPARISQSSTIETFLYGDPFQDFCFDPDFTQSRQNSQPSVIVRPSNSSSGSSSSISSSSRLRKRHGATDTSFLASGSKMIFDK